MYVCEWAQQNHTQTAAAYQLTPSHCFQHADLGYSSIADVHHWLINKSLIFVRFSGRGNGGQLIREMYYMRLYMVLIVIHGITLLQ